MQRTAAIGSHRKADLRIGTQALRRGGHTAGDHVTAQAHILRLLLQYPPERYGKLAGFIFSRPTEQHVTAQLSKQQRAPCLALLFLDLGIGYHVHAGDGELYYVLSGRGEYSDNGAVTTVEPGDVTFCPPGQGHSILCLGDEPLELITLVLYE